ncbi:hypothetical protein ACJIZ3_015309 [Penstemon smallii]|uniref:DNA-directed RNA polymerase I subunit rpa49 n=1 Tax=Penstemon smallii TaxID=265156 RepID=A0ABD3RQ60_9LAMI
MIMGKKKNKMAASEDEGNEKKMKRTGFRDERNKRPGIVVGEGKQFEILEVKIHSIAENEHKTSPILGYIPSGSEVSTDSTIKLYKAMDSPNPAQSRMQLVVAPIGSQLNFVGTNYSGEAATPTQSVYAFGVFDKEKRILYMFPIAAKRIFRLDPKLLGESSEPQHDEISKEEKADKRKNLPNMYTTTKNMRLCEKREILRKTEDPGSLEGLKQIKKNMKALEASASTANPQNIPPYNLDATAPDMVYALDKIILKGEWDYLLDIFELVEAGVEVNCDDYPSFVCNRVSKLRDVKVRIYTRGLAGILSYISHLIKFKDRNSFDGLSSAKRHKFPSILYQKFTFMFGDTRNKKRIPDEKQKLLISYVLVLSLFADDFQTDISDIAKDLRMDSSTLRVHYGYLGCKFVRINQAWMVTLPVPLKFDTLKRKRGSHSR